MPKSAVAPTTCRMYPNVTALLDAYAFNRRKSMGLSQEKLASIINVSRNCIHQLECHEHIPQLFTIFELLIALQFGNHEVLIFLQDLWFAYLLDRSLLVLNHDVEEVVR